MIYTKIKYESKNTISLNPVEIGNCSFQEFNCKIYNSNSISKNITYTDRTDEIIYVNGSNLENAAYWIYACFKNHKIDNFQLVKDGHKPIDCEYYTKINFVLSVNSSGELLSFTDAEIKENQLIVGGWYGITDNNLEASGVIDYISDVWGKMQLRRVNDICQMRGLADTTTAFSQWAVVIYLPYGFKPSQNQMFVNSVSDTFGMLQTNEYGNLSTRKAITSGYFFSVNTEWYI